MIQRYEYYNANIEPRSDGRIVFYADAEKWVQEEIAGLKESFNKERAKRCQCEFDGGEYFPCKYHGKKDEQIAVLSKFKKAVENDRCTECPFLEKETERAKEIAKKDNEIAQACVIIAEGLKIVEELEKQIAGLKSLVDGASDIVEIYPAESPAQKEWKADWLAKAREALK